MWDWIISFAIILAFILAVLCKATNSTIKELLTQIREFITESKEEVVDSSEEYIGYYY